MHSKTVIMLGIAVLTGTGAVVTGKMWLDKKAGQRLQAIQPETLRPTADRTIVVAATPLRYGVEITRQQLREIRWPEGDVPKGAFATIAEVLDPQVRRIALAPMEESEPLLRMKVTGPGQRASLTALIEPGMKAASVRVNDINGVAGFVLPGERVDLLLTRTLDKGEAFTDVLLQGVKVLAVDQSADERAEKPSLAKAVTFEVNTADAQKLALATTVGSLSLALRAAGSTTAEATARVKVEDLADASPAPVLQASTPAASPPPKRTLLVGVTRGMKRQEYTIQTLPPPIEETATVRATALAPRP